MQRPTNTWLCSSGVHLEVTATKIEHQASAHFWWPLHRVSRSAQHAGLPWPVHLDEFCFVGYRDRARSPGIWVYVHTRTGAEIFVDGQGQAYKQTPLRDDPIRGRFRKCDIRAACEQARLQLPEAKEQSAAAGMPVNAGIDPGQHLFAPRVLTPGRRADARQKARAAPSWEDEVRLARRAIASQRPAESSLRSGYIVLRPGLPRTFNFAERWEPRVIFSDPSIQASLDAFEAENPAQSQTSTSGNSSPPKQRRSPAGQRASRMRPAADRSAHPSRPTSRSARREATPSVPRLRQVWPPPAPRQRWSSY